MAEQPNADIIDKLILRISHLEARIKQQDIMNEAFQSQIGHNKNQINCIIYQIVPISEQTVASGSGPETVTILPTGNDEIVNVKKSTVSPIGTPKSSHSPTPSIINESQNENWGDIAESSSNTENPLIDSMDSNGNNEIGLPLNTETDEENASYASAVNHTPNTVNEGINDDSNQVDEFNLVSYKNKPIDRQFSFEYYLNADKIKELIGNHRIHTKSVDYFVSDETKTIYCGYNLLCPLIIATRDLALSFANIKQSPKQCERYGCNGFMCAMKHQNHHNMYPIGLDRFDHGICILSFMGYKCNIECLKNPKVFHHRIKDDENKKECPPKFLENIWKCPSNEYHQDCIFGCDA